MAKVIDAILRLQDNFSSTLQHAQDNLTRFSRQYNRAAKDMIKTGESVSRLGKTLTLGVTLPIVAAGTAAAKLAGDAVESENLFQISMGSMAGSARKYSEQISKSLGLNAYEVRKNIGTFNVMLGSMGMGKKHALGMSEGMTKLAYDMASFYNISNDEAFDKLKSGIVGMSKPLESLGINIKETQVQTYAYTHGIAKQGKKLSEQQKILARYGLIMQSTGKAHGDLARTANSPINQIRILKGQITQLGIEFGQLLIPMVQKAINIIKPYVTSLRNMSKEKKQATLKMLLFAASIGPILVLIGKLTTGLGKTILMVTKFAKAVKSVGLMSAIFTPGNIVILVLVAIALAAFLIIKHWKPIKAFFIGIWKSINAQLKKHQDIVNKVMMVVGILGKVFKTVFTIIFDVVKVVAIILAVVLFKAVSGVIGIISVLVKAIKGIVSAFMWVAGKLAPILKVIFEPIKNFINLIIDGLNKLIQGANKISFKTPKWLPGIGGKSFGFSLPQIPKLAKGTNNWTGGIVQVHERGGEIIDLPSGSRVYPHDKSVDMARKDGKKGLSLNIAKLADTIIIREEADIEKISNSIAEKWKNSILNYGGGLC